VTLHFVKNRRRTVAITRTVRAPGRSKTPAQRERKRKARQRRKLNQKEQLIAFRDISRGGFDKIGNFMGGPSYAGNEAVPNENYEPALPAMIGRGGASTQLLNSLGTTRAGQMWALKALHPNGEEVTASAGIPDHTNVPVVTPEFRVNHTITSIAGSTLNDDIDILLLPFAEIAFLWRRYPSTTTPDVSLNWNVVFNPTIPAANDTINYEDGDGVEHSLPYTYGDMNAYGRTRAMYRGVTVHLDAPALYDQGRIVAGQLALENKEGSVNGCYVTAGGTARLHAVSALNIVQLPQNLPLTEDDLFQATPGAVVWEAREGIYMPLRFRDPTHLFSSAQEETILTIYQPGGIESLLTPATPPKQIGLVMPVNFLSGLILIRGIDARANINVKHRIGLEQLVEYASVVAPFQHASPMLDPVAIDRVTQCSQASPMAFEAKYNDLGAIKNVLMSILGIGKKIGGVVRGLGIPGVSDIAGAGLDLIGALGLAPRRRRMRLRGAL